LVFADARKQQQNEMEANDDGIVDGTDIPKTSLRSQAGSEDNTDESLAGSPRKPSMELKVELEKSDNKKEEKITKSVEDLLGGNTEDTKDIADNTSSKGVEDLMALMFASDDNKDNDEDTVLNESVASSPQASPEKHKYKCEVEGCGRKFNHKLQFVNHQNHHSGEINFCVLFVDCFHRFSSIPDYRFVCHCGLRFKVEGLFIAHQRRRACDAADFTKGDQAKVAAKQAEKISKASKFKCPTCLKKFSDNSELRKHVEMKHEKKTRFTCPRCPKAFYFKSQIDKHFMKYHASV
jgi:Zinc finger, C2H2 type